MTFEEKKEIDDKLGITIFDVDMSLSKEEYEKITTKLLKQIRIMQEEGKLE